MALAGINLTEKDQNELKNKLDAWKIQEKKKIEEELTERYEQMEAELKERYENLVSEIKENMKKVYSKRFNKALREMYEQIRAEVTVESMNSPETKAFDEVKSAIFPFINESTARRYKDEFTKIASMYESVLEELEILKGRVKKAKLMEQLSPDVRKVVDTLLGEGTEEDIVTKFATIKEALKGQSKDKLVEEEDDVVKKAAKDDDDDDEEDEEEVIVKKAVDDEKEEEEEVKTEDQKEFENLLNEQLILAGVKTRSA